MLIGISLGRCLVSLMKGEVSEDDVLVIITGTDCPTYDSYISVIKNYHKHGNPYSRNTGGYNFGDISLDDTIDLAHRLWYGGKIHQPRVFGAFGGSPFAGLPTIWMDVVPVPDGSNESVMEAWDQYRTLAILAG